MFVTNVVIRSGDKTNCNSNDAHNFNKISFLQIRLNIFRKRQWTKKILIVEKRRITLCSVYSRSMNKHGDKS